jgi:hypothetical protein
MARAERKSSRVADNRTGSRRRNFQLKAAAASLSVVRAVLDQD